MKINLTDLAMNISFHTSRLFTLHFALSLIEIPAE